MRWSGERWAGPAVWTRRMAVAARRRAAPVAGAAESWGRRSGSTVVRIRRTARQIRLVALGFRNSGRSERQRRAGRWRASLRRQRPGCPVLRLPVLRLPVLRLVVLRPVGWRRAVLRRVL